MAKFMDTPIREIFIMVSENLFDSDQKAGNPCHLLKLKTHCLKAPTFTILSLKILCSLDNLYYVWNVISVSKGIQPHSFLLIVLNKIESNYFHLSLLFQNGPLQLSVVWVSEVLLLMPTTYIKEVLCIVFIMFGFFFFLLNNS